MELRFFNKGIIICSWITKADICVILAPGIPQYLTKYHPFVQTMIKLGVNLFIPSYKGTWESPGKFSIKESVKSIENTINFVRQCSGQELYNKENIKWQQKKIILIGFSFGALPALLSKETVDKTILIHPFVNSKIHKKYNGEDLNKTFSFVKKAYLMAYRLSPSKVINELNKLHYPLFKNNLKIISGKKDNSIPKEEIDWLKMKYPDLKHIELDSEHTLNLPMEIYFSLLKDE